MNDIKLYFQPFFSSQAKEMGICNCSRSSAHRLKKWASAILQKPLLPEQIIFRMIVILIFKCRETSHDVSFFQATCDFAVLCFQTDHFICVFSDMPQAPGNAPKVKAMPSAGQVAATSS